jgi:hypothetical protein
MNGKVFINYRRDDSSASAGRLYDRLSSHFPKDQIFIDVDNLDPGVDFVEAIEQSVVSCDALIAVIGRHWLISADEKRRRRLDNPEDFVRLEIASALKRDIRVIPVLVDGASMPSPSELPDDLKALVRRNAVEVSHTRFSTDSERLVAALERIFEKTEAEQHEREEKERLEPQGREHTPKEQVETERLAAKDQERLQAERAQKEEQERLELEAESPPPGPVAPTLNPQEPEASKPSAQTPKPVQPVLPKPGKPEQKKLAPSPSARTEGESLPRRLVAFLAIVAVLLVCGLVYLVTKPPIPTPSAAELLSKAQRSLDEREFAKALPLLQKAADAGNPIAMNNLGVLYQSGEGVVQDYGRAAEWYLKAADAGNYDAMANLGCLYRDGKSVAQDYGKAREWFQKAADAGNSLAMNSLGVLYLNGNGVAQDYGKAREWFQKAADAGNSLAMNNLGILYQSGKGVAQDYGKAGEWYLKAADAGNPTP